MSVAHWLTKTLQGKLARRRGKARRQSRPFAERFAARLAVKPLENRVLLSATQASIDIFGNLVLADADGSENDNITIQTIEDQIIITSTAGFELGAGLTDGGNTTFLNPNTISIDAASVGGQIIANTGDGNDTLTLDFTIRDFNKGVEFNGGSGADTLILRDTSGRLIASAEHTLSGGGAGSAHVAASSAIAYSGTEEVRDLLTVTNRSLQFTSGAEAIAVSAGVALGLRAETDAGGAVEFNAPQGNLTLAGDADDALSLTAHIGVGGTTTLEAGTIDLQANVVGAVTGSTATSVSVANAGEIQDAVNVAAGGATISAADGSYIGDVVVDRQLTLLGANAGIDAKGRIATETVIEGNIFVTTTGNVTIDGFTINGSISDPGADLVIQNNIIDSPGTAIDISDANSALIENNQITAGGDGIFGQFIETNVTITGNIITLTGPGDGNGIFLDTIYHGSVIASGNVIGGSLFAGIFARGTVNGSFTADGNEVSGAREIGIHAAEFAQQATITNNTITSVVANGVVAQGIYASNLAIASDAGVVIQGNEIDVIDGGIWVESVQGAVQVGGTGTGEKNTIDSAAGRGILLSGNGVMGAATVQNNAIIAGSAGIEVDGAVNAFVATGNTIEAAFEAGISVHDSAAPITIGGPNPEDANVITMTGALAGIAVLNVTDGVTVEIEGNRINTDADTLFGIDAEAIDGTLLVRSNTLNAAITGLFVSGVSETVTIDQNQIAGGGILGMAVSFVDGAVLIDNNTVDAMLLGIDVGDSPDVTVTGNTVTADFRGIYGYSVASLTFADNSVTITDAGQGVVFDGQAGATEVDFGTGNVIDGGEIGLVLVGGQLSLDGDTLSNLVVSGQTTAHIGLFEGAFVLQEIDGTGVTYDGVLGSDIAVPEEGFTIEDKIIHAIDYEAVGFVRIHEASLYVTPDSFFLPETAEAWIQRAINVAVDNDTVFVEAGFYNGDLTIDRPLTLSGPNVGSSAVTGARVEEAELFGAITVATDGSVIIDGFKMHAPVANDGASAPDLAFQNNFIDISGPTPSLDITGVQSALIVGNHIASNNDTTIFGSGVLGDVTVQGNLLLAVNRGIDLDGVGGVLLVGGSLPAQTNAIVANGSGIVAYNLAGDFTAEGNAIDGFEFAGVEVVSTAGGVNLIDNRLTSFVAASQGVSITLGAAGVMLQGNAVEVDGDAVLLESVQGTQQIGGGPGEGNTINSFAGGGVRVLANSNGEVNIEYNQITTGNEITSGGPGIELLDGDGDLNIRGNFIVSVFDGVNAQSAILVQNVSAGNITIGGLDPAAGNAIGVVDGFAGIEVRLAAGDLTIQNNTITSQTAIVPPDPDNPPPLETISIFAETVEGATTVQRNTLGGSELFGVDMSNLIGTVTIGGLLSGGSVRVQAMNDMVITAETGYAAAGIDAGVSTILLEANQDGAGSEGFLQDTAAPIETFNNTANAIIIRVGGNGDAAISVLRADTAEDLDTFIVGTITIEAGGAIIDNRDGDGLGTDTNITAHTAILFAGTGIGDNSNALNDIDTAVSFLTGATAAGDIDIDEFDNIELGNLWALTGAIWVNSNGGAIDIRNTEFLQSKSGQVSNAPPLLRLNEVNPNDVITPGDPTQEVTGTIGGIEGLGDNLELGVNFQLTVVWDDGVVSTLGFPTAPEVTPDVTGLPDDAKLRAGDTIVWLIDEENISTAQIIRGSGEGPINITIQRTYSLLYLQTVQAPEVIATFTLYNDPNIILTDATGIDLNVTVPLSIPTALSEENFGQVAIVIAEQAPITFDEPTPAVYIDVAPPQQGQTNIYAELSLGEKENQEEVALLYLVRVMPDGSEGPRIMLPLSDLRNLSALLERLKTAQIPSGLYRIYYQEPGLPPQQVLEFRKTGNAIGDPVREPGRGSNPAEEAPAGEGDAAAPPAANQDPGAPPNDGALLPAPAAVREHVETALRQATPGSFSRYARQMRQWQQMPQMPQMPQGESAARQSAPTAAIA